jgi:hypothetical protein
MWNPGPELDFNSPDRILKILEDGGTGLLAEAVAVMGSDLDMGHIGLPFVRLCGRRCSGLVPKKGGVEKITASMSHFKV